MTILRGFAAGAVSAGLSCLAIYHVSLERQAPYIEYEEKKSLIKTGMLRIKLMAV